MMRYISNIFKSEFSKGPENYAGLSDFLIHASADEQKKVFMEAARRANEDQLKMFREATLKAKAQ